MEISNPSFGDIDLVWLDKLCHKWPSVEDKALLLLAMSRKSWRLPESMLDNIGKIVLETTIKESVKMIDAVFPHLKEKSKEINLDYSTNLLFPSLNSAEAWISRFQPFINSLALVLMAHNNANKLECKN